MNKIDWNQISDGGTFESLMHMILGKPKGNGKPKGDAAQFASIEFFHWLAIAMNRRRLEGFQRIDNNDRRRMLDTMIEIARFKTPSWQNPCKS